MIEVTVFTEGQTEEAFIKMVVAPSVRELGIFVKPETLKTSKDSRGGDVSYDRLKFYATNNIRGNSDKILTTFLDFYGLKTDFPGFNKINTINGIYNKIAHLEVELHHNLVSHMKCRPERFKPHIQPYEFEGLLFSDALLLTETEPKWKSSKPKVEAIISEFESPEHINDGYETKPSARLESILYPKYKKTRHGPLIAQNIGLNLIEEKCFHFKEWMDWLRSLV